jgi:hypothetical protein
MTTFHPDYEQRRTDTTPGTGNFEKVSTPSNRTASAPDVTDRVRVVPAECRRGGAHARHDNAGHLMNVEAPAEYNAAVGNFLGGRN